VGSELLEPSKELVELCLLGVRRGSLIRIVVEVVLSLHLPLLASSTAPLPTSKVLLVESLKQSIIISCHRLGIRIWTTFNVKLSPELRQVVSIY
jgi:hypothetical protein